MDKSIVLENNRFNESIRLNEGGSIFLGYLYSEVTFVGGLADGEDFKIGCPDLEVRITVAGTPRVDFPTEEKEIKGETKRVAKYFSASKGTREALTAMVFALPQVSRAVEKAERKREAAAAA